MSTRPVGGEALLYYRISEDKTGERLGVDRQEPDTLALLDRLGLTPGEVYIDNDLSATTGVERPDFERLLRDLKDDPRPVAVWHLDRLLRLSRDLERVIETGVNIYAAHAGYFDLSTPAGRAVARTVTAWSQYEGEQKAIRQKAAALQRAQAGKKWWPVRPFGLNMDGTLHEAEAPALRSAYDNLLAGVSLAAIARELNDKGLHTIHGNPWTAMTLRPVMLNARNAGIRVYNGEEIGPAAWATIVPEETYRAACYVLEDASRKTGTTGKRIGLLTGVATCGVCESPVRMVWRGKKGEAHSYRTYNCRANNHVSMRVDWVDTYVERLVKNHLSTPEGAAYWEGDSTEDAGDARREAIALRARLEELVDMLADGEMTRSEYGKARERTLKRLEAAEATLAQAGRSQGLHGALSAAEVVKEWKALGTDKQRAHIEALAESIVINRRGRGQRGLREGDIEVTWRQSISSK